VRSLLSSTLILALGLSAMPAEAQITSDGSLNTAIAPAGTTFTITGGATSGNNLFHSFLEFSVPTNGSAFFNNAAEIVNIFSRVTGGNLSNIDGLIKANGNANLFLLNPNGIIFGPNARLNIGGSFLGSTANSINFADGTQFSATNPTGTPLLTVSVPIGLQFGQNPGGITVQGTGHLTTGGLISPFNRSKNPIGLQVGAGNTLALVGGDINVQGGILTATGGQIALGSIGPSNAASVVGLQPGAQGWNLNYNAIQQFGDIALSQAALLDASSNGAIALQGRNISLQNGSLALIQNIGATPAGDIRVNASGLLSIAGMSSNRLVRSGLENQTVGAGNGGNIQVSASDVAIADGAGILTRSFGPGTAGNIAINVTRHLQVTGFIPNTNANSIIGSLAFWSGNAGTIQIAADRLTLLAAGNITSSTIGTGKGGNVEVDVTGTIEIAGFNSLTESVSNIGSATFGSGDSGSVRVNANNIILRDRGKITTGGFARGNAGSVVVNAAESIAISDEFTTIDSSIEILPPITRIAFFLPDIPSGNAGSVTVNAPILRIGDRGQVSVRNDGIGNAGSLQINAHRLELNRQGAITASTQSGEGGNIALTLRDLAIARNNSSINTESKGSGNGGNITINSPVIIGLENSDIIANAVQGNGGNILITANSIFGTKFRPQLTPESDITASSQFGVNGIVTINNPDVDPGSSLAQLPEDVTDPSQQIATGCSALQESQFVVTGRGGLPPNPSEQLNSTRTWSDVRDLSAFRSSETVAANRVDAGTEESSPRSLSVAAEPEPANSPAIVEATGWIVNEAGRVELVASVPHPGTPKGGQVNCSGNSTVQPKP
jgi:filamentous hemagglutinin family protein